uniref:BPTI/Kunitz inhibitor domain-containing protein n=1 Tax=Caenorhabditis tropicalis TaxID=1561998 RepID=A0A1I7TM29_9PELO
MKVSLVELLQKDSISMPTRKLVFNSLILDVLETRTAFRIELPVISFVRVLVTCSSSEVVYQPSNLDEPFDCSLKTCPRHFSCVKNVWDETKNVCCGSPNFGVCSSTQHPMIMFSSQQPMSCTPNTQNSCPLGFQCTYSSIRMLYFCCRGIERIDKCLQGSRPEIWQSTAEPRACSRDSQCHSTTSCFTPIPFSSGLCCARIDEICPATFIYDEEKSSDGQCSPLEKNTCGRDGQSVCLFSDLKNRFVCCRREARQIQALAKCPPGSIMELTKTYCDPESPCPKTHFCMKKSSDRKGICCRHPSLKRVMPMKTRRIGASSRKQTSRNRCPKGEKILKVEGEVKECRIDDDCPEFYKCISQGQSSVCCGLDITEICPTRVYPAIRVQKCSMCAVGYECHKNYCCPQKEVACAQPIPELNNEEESEDSIVRFYYDSETNTCHSFNYRKGDAQSSTAQNHFSDHSSCIEMCVHSPINEEDLECPHPYINPLDHPQMCITSLKSCSDSETCLKTTTGKNYVFISRHSTDRGIPSDAHPAVDVPVEYVDRVQFLDTVFVVNGEYQKVCSFHSQMYFLQKKRHFILIQFLMKLSSLSARLLIRPLSEGQIKKPICRSDAESTMGSCLPKLFPGETECEIDGQCVSPSTCLDKRCTCPKGTVQFRRMCGGDNPLINRNLFI